MNKHAIKIFQMSLVPLFKLLNFIVVRRKKIEVSRADLASNRTYVIVANHRGVLDPFVIGYSLPTNINTKLTPWRFFVQNRFFRIIPLKPLLFLLGCFPARKQAGISSGLDYGLSLLRDQQNMVIFPEGKISRFDEKILPKTGVEVLAKENGVLFLPARVRRIRSRWLFRSYSLSIGQPFDAKNMTAEQIMDVVYNLKFR